MEKKTSDIQNLESLPLSSSSESQNPSFLKNKKIWKIKKQETEKQNKYDKKNIDLKHLFTSKKIRPSISEIIKQDFSDPNDARRVEEFLENIKSQTTKNQS